jgi:hypothetical protein
MGNEPPYGVAESITIVSIHCLVGLVRIAVVGAALFADAYAVRA